MIHDINTLLLRLDIPYDHKEYRRFKHRIVETDDPKRRVEYEKRIDNYHHADLEYINSGFIGNLFNNSRAKMLTALDELQELIDNDAIVINAKGLSVYTYINEDDDIIEVKTFDDYKRLYDIIFTSFYIGSMKKYKRKFKIEYIGIDISSEIVGIKNLNLSTYYGFVCSIYDNEVCIHFDC